MRATLLLTIIVGIVLTASGSEATLERKGVKLPKPTPKAEAKEAKLRVNKETKFYVLMSREEFDSVPREIFEIDLDPDDETLIKSLTAKTVKKDE